MIAAAESNGHSAIHPGNAPCTSTSTPTEIMLTNPSHPRSTPATRPTRTYGSTRASREPSANSHKRVRVSKYANSCRDAVVTTENAREVAKTRPKQPARTGTQLRAVRRRHHHASAKISGHTRNTWPCTDRDQKCWNGDAVEWSAA